MPEPRSASRREVSGGGPSALDELVERSRRRAERTRGEDELRAMAADRTRPAISFQDALRAPGLSLIAEFKRSSPSAGAIAATAGVSSVVSGYERGGAAALSVLTEPTRFSGSLEDLGEARRASVLPILRKDFLVDERQVLEAAAWGADAVLLIVAALDRGRLADLVAAASETGLDCLVEVHREEELEPALELEHAAIGINNRDLRTLEVDTATTARLAGLIPQDRTVVSESGWSEPEQVAALAELGVDAVLVGEALMRSGDPERGTAQILGRDGHP